MFKLNWGAVCIKGNFRDNNEDRYHINPEVRYFIVADGMGGQNAGERASEIATSLIPQRLNELLSFDEEDDQEVIEQIDNSVTFANNEIMAMSELDPKCKNMGTTVVMLVAAGEHLYIGGIGDSRAYQLHDGKLTQLTIDHTLTEALRRAGTINDEEAKHHRYQNVLHRYLGSAEGSKGAELQVFQPTTGDRYLLCSDGVTGGVEDPELAELLCRIEDPQEAAETIVKQAETGGSKDNITCIVVDVIDPA